MSLNTIAASLAILGSLFELTGVVLMARRYVNTGLVSAISAMFGSLIGSETAKDVVYGARVTKDDAMTALRGLALVAIGFTLTAAAVVVNVTANGGS